MFSKSKSIWVHISLFFLVPIAYPLFIHCSDNYLEDNVFDFFDNNVELNPTVVCTNADPGEVVDILVCELDALCILQQDFFRRTNELNQRNLLDYAIFLPQKYYARPWAVGAHLFYNQTTRDNFTRTSTKICSYLAVFKETLLQELQRRIEQINPDLPIDLRAILPLFRNTTIQERRGGLMIHGMRKWGSYRFRFLFPFYYIESNFFLTPEELDLIEQQLGITDPAEDTRFAREHLIADKLGFGDTRLNLDFPFAKTPNVNMKLGLQATIPTAFAIKNGLYGSHFKKLCRGPILDFCNIINLALEQRDFEAVQKIAEQFALCALDNLSANLIDIPLGNGGHFGLGAYMRSKTKLSSIIHRPWADMITMRSRISLEYLFARRKIRFFIEKSDRARFEALGLNRDPDVICEQALDDPAYARAVLGFLESQFTDKFFPFGISTKVWPGIIFRWMTKYIYEEPRWGWWFGTDTWIISKERLTNLRIPKDIPPILNKKIAKKPFGYQVGILASAFWKLKRSWLLSLNFEYNFASTGIGKDYILTFNFERSF